MDLTSQPSPRKQVALHGVVPSRHTLRAVKRQVEQWIAREQSLLFLPKKDSQYSVEIESDSRGEDFNCAIQVRIGSRLWAARHMGHSVKEAVEQSLADLKFVHALA